MKQELWHGDCLELMKDIPDNSIDAIICDLPFGTTQNKWDTVIDFNFLWEQYNRISKDSAAIVLNGQSLFSAKLILSNEKYYRYSLIWEKTKAGGFLNAKRMPLQAHEDIVVFYKKLPTYNPQFEIGKPYIKKSLTNGDKGNYGTFERAGQTNVNDGKRFPRSVIKISNDNHKSLHRTQKPLKLMEYLIKTYSNEGDLILDNCMGSGTTCLAAKNLNRQFIGIEKEKEYYDICVERLL